ncbi:hypothetical protein BamMEX5DRAFT_5823 [Burkholderia ambifaria MEX-5]|uniref:Uncharacterized protein n=1 Tax=Burkholderia ambifaria MEX-5 TaxID=396597 RepID=B1TDF7_9BURK|nr:hypothetical protein BamMEX5DRAFT_5823 [Burkholderia ambifaria MEX-5]
MHDGSSEARASAGEKAHPIRPPRTGRSASSGLAPCVGRYPGWPLARPQPSRPLKGSGIAGGLGASGNRDARAAYRCGDSTGRANFRLLFPV